MSVSLVSNFDPRNCTVCEPDFNILVAMLGATVDANGNLYPVGVNMTNEFTKHSIQSHHNQHNNYELTFTCGATCNVDKPQNRWLIDLWKCTHVVIRGVLGMIADIWAKTKPVHPGQVLKRWFQSQPDNAKETVAKITEMQVDQLEQIMECRAPIDEMTARKLSRYFEQTAEIWYRMQHDYDYFEKTGVRIDAAELPKFTH